MATWKALLLIYDKIDVRYRASRWRRKHFVHQLGSPEVEEAEDSFRHFPPLVEELTEGRASVEYAIAHLDDPLRHVSPISWGGFWPGPNDTKSERLRYAPAGAFDSIFVFWPQTNFAAKRAVPSGGWGFGMGASAETNGATYAAIANAPSAAWRRPRVGEVWLHEWLHGVCHHFARSGHTMPDGDADGGERHGYVQSPTTGWMDYYRDLMNGRVMEEGKPTGIQTIAWLDAISRDTFPV